MKSKREFIEELKKLQLQYDQIEREAKAMQPGDERYKAHLKKLERIIYKVNALQWNLKVCMAPPNYFVPLFRNRR